MEHGRNTDKEGSSELQNSSTRDISDLKLQSEGASGELCGTRLAQSVQVVGVPHLGDAEGGMECAELFDPAGVGEFYGETPEFIRGYSGRTPPGSWDGARRNVSWWDRLALPPTGTSRGVRAGAERAKYTAKKPRMFAFVRHCSGFWEFFYFVIRRWTTVDDQGRP